MVKEQWSCYQESLHLLCSYRHGLVVGDLDSKFVGQDGQGISFVSQTLNTKTYTRKNIQKNVKGAQWKGIIVQNRKGLGLFACLSWYLGWKQEIIHNCGWIILMPHFNRRQASKWL